MVILEHWRSGIGEKLWTLVFGAEIWWLGFRNGVVLVVNSIIFLLYISLIIEQ
jgi:hypothetical protein